MDNIGPNGSLNNDNFLGAILQVRNAPDPDCNISPAEMLFGRPLRDAFSFVNRLSKFENPTIRPTWRQAWSCKEEAMNLPPLKQGDKVFVQNQMGSHPTKWDASGTVMDAGQHDQYTVKIDGTGRVTLRNRRFLRKFTPATLDITSDPRSIPPVQTIPQLTDQPMVADESMNLQPTMLPTEPSADPSPILPPSTLHPTTTAQAPESTTRSPSPTSTDVDTPAPPPERRVSERVRMQRKHYNAESGMWE